MSMSMKDLGREERGKKGAMSRQWREIGLLTKNSPSFLRDPPSVPESLVYSQNSLSSADFIELN